MKSKFREAEVLLDDVQLLSLIELRALQLTNDDPATVFQTFDSESSKEKLCKMLVQPETEDTLILSEVSPTASDLMELVEATVEKEMNTSEEEKKSSEKLNNGPEMNLRLVSSGKATLSKLFGFLTEFEIHLMTSLNLSEKAFEHEGKLFEELVCLEDQFKHHIMWKETPTIDVCEKRLAELQV